jgi:hypothetical protein
VRRAAAPLRSRPWLRPPSFRVSQQQGLRDRTALLGTPDAHGFATPPASGRASPAGSMMNAHAYADDLEGQNEEHLEGLAAKVKLLKDVRALGRLCAGRAADRGRLCRALQIGLAVGNEVRESTKQLSEMVRARPVPLRHARALTIYAERRVR